MSEPILKVEGVQAKYGDFIAVESATMDVPEGQMFLSSDPTEPGNPLLWIR